VSGHGDIILLQEVVMAVGLIVGGVLQGLGELASSALASKSQRAQAQQMRNNVKALQDEIARGQIEMEEGIKRLDDLIATAKGEIKSVMEKQVDLAAAQLKKQYRTGLETAARDIGERFTRRGLGASEALAAGQRKTAVGLAKQAGEQATGMRERALSEISRQMTALDLKGGLAKEAKREAFQRFRLGALGEIMQLQNMAGTLERETPSPFLAAFRGAVRGGFGDLIGKAVTPGPELKEAPTGQAIPELQEPKTFLR
jgi:hypothetical protein